MPKGFAWGIRARGTDAQTPAAPSWTDITVGTWAEIPGDTLADVDPDPTNAAGYAGSAGIAGSVTAWNGGAFNEDSAVMWLTALGGHGDYLGNGVFKWVLNAATPAWTMVLSPSVVADYTTAAGTASAYSDGRPRSTHSYNACVYAPDDGPFLMGIPARSTDGGDGTRSPVKFNESSGAATFLTAPTSSGSGTPVASCFDPTRGTRGSIWRRHGGTSVMQRYDIAADTWTNVGSSQAYAAAMSMTYIPGHDVILLGNGDADTQTFQWRVFDCAAETYHSPTFTGAPSVGVAHSGGLWPGLCQPRWVPSLDAACAWDNDTSRTLITSITPPSTNPTSNAWTVSTLSVDGGNTVTPSTAQAAGTFGRFAYWPAAKGFVLFNSKTDPGYFFKAHS